MRSYRLPWTVVPSRYEIELEPDLGRGRFTGRETIEVAVKEPVQEIVLNAADLEIHAAGIRDKEGREWSATMSLDEENERMRLAFPEPLQPGPWRLTIAFTGILNDKLRGFYRSRFTAADGAKEMLAVTQFEATDARRAFPCWDEPAFKAVFQVTLLVDEGLCALSNSSVASTRPIRERGKVAVAFAPTIPMSTDLLAFARTGTCDRQPVDVGALLREGRASVRILPTRERWFGVTYPEDRPAFRTAILGLVDAGVYPRDLWSGA